MAHPKLSVTMTNYNYGEYLPRAIESILRQSFTDFELIIVDNASTDDSPEIISRYAAGDDRVRPILRSENQGALASLREGCDLARGEYRVHVDADDWIITDDAFEHQVAHLDAHPTMAFTYSCMVQIGPDDELIWVSHPYGGDRHLSGGEALEAILSFTLNHSGTMLRLDAYRAIGGYAEGLPQVDDMDLAARLCAQGTVGYLDRQLYAFRQHGTNANARPELGVVTEQFLPVIEAALDGPAGDQIPDRELVRRRVVRRALLHLPTRHVFSGQPRIGWRLWLESLRARPRDTLLQRQTVALVARTLLGERLYATATGRPAHG